ncbi:MAG: hypothetical protein SV253_08675, partial [Halobacteria archaeon]|nr:hypothetical protein [Halobacteria archaeon]
MSGRDVDIDYLHGLFDSAEILDGIRQGKDQMDDLEDHVDGSRSTLHRKMKFLRNRNLVRRDDDTFGLTPKGEAVLDGLSEFTHHIKTVEELEPFLEHVGETVDELSRLSGSTVYTPKDGRPHYPVKLLIESVEEASYVRGFSPVVTPTYVTVFHRRITQGMRAEIVLENPLVRVLED